MSRMGDGNLFTTPTPASRTSRYNNIDPPEPTNLFSMSDSSPATVRKTLEVHGEELQRRIQLVAKLGESLMRQQNELRERLMEVEQENYESDEEATIDPNLKAKLADLEKSYNDVERESARAFLSVKPVAANISPSGAQSGLFSSTGSVSPNRIAAPASSRRQRNQPSRIQDIEFAADIGQSLLVEVRRLQALLQEREDTLKTVEMERTRLVEDLQLTTAKVRALEEEDNQLKEINWNLEVVVQEVRSSESEAKDIIERLHNQVNILNREKNEVISKWDDYKLAQQKIAESMEDELKHNEAELALLRRNLSTKETECEGLSKKVEELKQEVDESNKTTLRLRLASENLARQHLEPEDAYDSKQADDETPDHTPSVSPVKATPRHSALESETLKSSLHHAHRMIANLKNTIHREKTEKSELRRMLQEARDEVEQARQGVVAPSGTNKPRKGKHDNFKKPSRPLVGLLGENRKPKAEIIAISDGENDDWIDDPNAHSPTLRPGVVRSRRPSKHSSRRPSPQPQISFTSSTDTSSFESSFETANEEESDVFATADEPETETDAHYATGLETGRDEPTSQDDLTETEGVKLQIRSRRSSTLSRRTVIAKSSYASVRKNSIITDTSEDDSDYQRFQDAAQDSEGMYDTGSPVPRHQRFKVRVARGRGRLSHRVGSNGSLYQTAAAQIPDSPIAINTGRLNGRSGPDGSALPPAPAASLFAELGGGSFMDTEPEDQAEEDEEEVPTAPTTPALPPVEYVDCGVNTEVPYPEPPPMVVPKIAITTGSDPIEELKTPKRNYANTAGSPIQEIMTPRAIFADIATGTGDELMTPKRVMAEASTHTGNDLMTPKRVMAEASTHTGNDLMTPKRVMTEAGTHTGNDLMTPKRVMTEAGTHTGNDLMTPKRMMADAGSEPMDELKTPRRIMVSSGTDILEELRTPKPAMTSSGTQYLPETPRPVAVMAFADIQTSPIRTNDGATQLGSPIRVRETRDALGSPIHTKETREFFGVPIMASTDVQTSPVRTSDGATQIKTPLGSPIRTRETKDGSTQHVQTPKPETASSNVQTSPIRLPETANSNVQTSPIRGPETASTDVQTSPIRTSDGSTQISTPLGSPVRTSDGATQSTPMVSPPRRKEMADGATQVTPMGSPRRSLLPAFGFRSKSQSPTRSVDSSKEENVAVPSEEKEIPKVASAEPATEVQPASEGSTPKKVSETIDESNRPVTPTPQKDNTGFLGSLFTWKRRGSESVGVDIDVERPSSGESQEQEKPTLPHVVPVHEAIDVGVQTAIGFDFFENLGRSASPSSPRKTTSFVPVLDSNGNIIPQVIQPTRPSSAGILKNRASQDSMSVRPITPTLLRPGSASSAADRTGAPHPPMPTDHRELIQKHVGPAENTTMGPPLFAASVTKSSSNTLRPFTPVNQTSSIIPVVETPDANRGGATPKPRANGRESALSRRSSVTSFASELDERFGTITDGMPNRTLTDSGTEPRMIQAITQTMIGEYLWKYTRNAGRGSMSTNRHRRFFWVHPYTRTLYWSDRDPASAGRQELRAKSVSIEGVRVISDDNPMPPGLHRKSLVIITPGRSLKFTAPTSQRHETWFNALSYLLLRTNTEELEDGETIMASDFNPGYRSTGRNHAPSLSSYNSRTTRNSVSPSRNESSLSNSRPRGPYQGSINRLSNIFRPGSTLGFTSFRGSKQNLSQAPSIYDASDAHDSQEDLRLQMDREEMEAARMENVRACCDGKHDVGTLNKKGATPRRSQQKLGHTHNHHHHNHTHEQSQPTPSQSPSPTPALQ